MDDNSITNIFISYSFKSHCNSFVQYISNYFEAVNFTVFFHDSIEHESPSNFRTILFNEIKASDLFIIFIDYSDYKIPESSSIQLNILVEGFHRNEFLTAINYLNSYNICVCLVGFPKNMYDKIIIDDQVKKIIHIPEITSNISSQKILYTFLNENFNMNLETFPIVDNPTDPWSKEYSFLQIANICHLEENEFLKLYKNLKQHLKSENKLINFITYCGSCDSCKSHLSEKFKEVCFEKLENRIINLKNLLDTTLWGNDRIIIAQGKCEEEIAKRIEVKPEHILYNALVINGKEAYKIAEFRGITFISLQDSFLWEFESFKKLFSNLKRKDKVSSNIKIINCFYFKNINGLSPEDTLSFFQSEGLDLILCNSDIRKVYPTLIETSFIQLKNTQIFESKSNDDPADKYSFNYFTIKQDFLQNELLLEEIIKVKIEGITITRKPHNKHNHNFNTDPSITTSTSKQYPHNRIDYNIYDLLISNLFNFINSKPSKPIKIIVRSIPETDYSPAHIIFKHNLDKEIVIADFKNVFIEINKDNIFDTFWKEIYNAKSESLELLTKSNLFNYEPVKNEYGLKIAFKNLITHLKMGDRAKKGVWFVFDNWEGFNGIYASYSSDDRLRKEFITLLKTCLTSNNDRIILIINKFAIDSNFTGVGNWSNLPFIEHYENPAEMLLTDLHINELIERCHIRNTIDFRSFIDYATGKSFCAIQDILLKIRCLKNYDILENVGEQDFPINLLHDKSFLMNDFPKGSHFIKEMKKFTQSYEGGGMSSLLQKISAITKESWSISEKVRISLPVSDVESYLGNENVFDEDPAWIYFNLLIDLGFIDKQSDEYVITAPIAFINI